MLTLTGSEQFAQRFQREATIMMGFQHVNIVNYFDHFKTASSYCMVMEYVDGCSVHSFWRKHRYLADDVALLILRDTLRALAFAHSKGVVHRDIKPANILISSKGEVKLTDFGIAHNQTVDADGLTKEGMTLGTPLYMAPEQFRNAGTVDGRADIYSCGILLYECLTGRKPFTAPLCRKCSKEFGRESTKDCGKPVRSPKAFPIVLCAAPSDRGRNSGTRARRKCSSALSVF